MEKRNFFFMYMKSLLRAYFRKYYNICIYSDKYTYDSLTSAKGKQTVYDGINDRSVYFKIDRSRAREISEHTRVSRDVQ